MTSVARLYPIVLQPIVVRLGGRRALVVGGGEMAARGSAVYSIPGDDLLAITGKDEPVTVLIDELIDRPAGPRTAPAGGRPVDD